MGLPAMQLIGSSVSQKHADAHVTRVRKRLAAFFRKLITRNTASSQPISLRSRCFSGPIREIPHYPPAASSFNAPSGTLLETFNRLSMKPSSAGSRVGCLLFAQAASAFGLGEARNPMRPDKLRAGLSVAKPLDGPIRYCMPAPDTRGRNQTCGGQDEAQPGFPFTRYFRIRD